MMLVGTKGTIQIGSDALLITYMNGRSITAPLKELSKFIKSLEIYTTTDGSFTLGEW